MGEVFDIGNGVGSEEKNLDFEKKIWVFKIEKL